MTELDRATADGGGAGIGVVAGHSERAARGIERERTAARDCAGQAGSKACGREGG